MVSVVGLRPPKLAPGISSLQRALVSVLAMASLYLSVVNHSCADSLSAAQPQHMLCRTRDCPQNHFYAAHNFIAALRACSSDYGHEIF